MDAQALYDLFRSRQSDRHYDTTRTIPREVLQRIVENALLAPSATLADCGSRYSGLIPEGSFGSAFGYVGAE